jgi:hypothetical protein
MTGGGVLQLIFHPTNFIRVNIFPNGLTQQYLQKSLFNLQDLQLCFGLACIKAIIHIRPLSFYYDIGIPNI